MAARKVPLRERIVSAAAELLARGGRDAVSTRAVSAAAGVQAPAIYRQFGDMRGLLDAAAREVLAEYVRKKARRAHLADPLDELRNGWDEHVAFGLANPAAYALLYGTGSAGATPSAAREGLALLEALVTRVAAAGRLKVSVPSAVRLIHAGGCGVTFSLLSAEPGARDVQLSHSMREAVIAAITAAPAATAGSSRGPKVARGAGRVATRAVALRSVLQEAETVLSAGERQVMAEWLDRLASVTK